MAFVSRAKRETLPGLGAEGQAVGPGSYAHPDGFRAKFGYAPFSSTAERELGVRTRAGYTPGPGSYLEETLVKYPQGEATSNAFVSRTRRFGDERRSAAEAPG